MKLKQKKGDVFQLIWLMIILFFIATIGLFTYIVAHRFTDQVAATGILASAPTAVKANAFMGTQSKIIADEFVFFMFLGGIIAVLIAAARTNFSPTILFLYVILLFIAVLISGGLVNIYQGFAQSPEIAAEGSQLVLTNIIFSKYTPLVMCAIGGLIMMIMYGKSGSNISV